MTSKEVKKALIDLSKTQNELADEIQKVFREILQPPELSAILSGRQQGAKAERVRLECETIIRKWKEEETYNERSQNL